MKTSEVERLEERLVRVNSLEPKELKPYFSAVLRHNKEKTQRGGAGLGLIMVKRKSENPIEYRFNKISRSVTEVFLRVKISIDNNKMLRYEQTKHTPFVQFDIKSERFELFGHSRPENADGFYLDIVDWVLDKKEQINKMKSPKLIVDLEYYNSSSLKNLVRLFRIICECAPDTLKIEWHFDEDDESAKDEGIEISEIIKKKFILIEK